MSSTSEENSYSLVGGITELQVILKNKYDSSKAIDLLPQIIDITIIEDIFSPTIYGSMMLLDAIDLLNGIGGQYKPIVGEETIEISFKLKGRKDFKLSFDSWKLENIKDD